jgi:hypothetical protein
LRLRVLAATLLSAPLALAQAAPVARAPAAAAPNESGRDAERFVVVLKASVGDALAWEEGTGAVVAELLTTGYSLSIRAAGSDSTQALRAELEAQLARPHVTGAVAVLRSREHGVALVFTRRFGFERIQVALADEALSRSQLALGVVDRMRNLEIALDAAVEPAPRAAAEPAPRAAAEPARPAVEPAPRALELWLGAGAVVASGFSSPLPWLSVSGAVALFDPIGIEGSLGLSPLATQVTTSAGSLRLRAEQASLFLTFTPFARRQYGVALGLGGGATFVRETASPAAGYVGFAETANVGLVSARARAFARFGKAFLVLGIDPGLLVPAVGVQAAGEQALGIGRPWLTLSAGVGWQP